MHSTACGVASRGSITTLTQSSPTDGRKMVHNDDAMNKIPLKSAGGLDDEERNGGEFIQDTSAAEEAIREARRAKLLAWMKKLTIVLICFIGIALISYVIISLCFSDWPKSRPAIATTTTTSTTVKGNTITTIATTTTTPPPSPISSSTATTTTTNTNSNNSFLPDDNNDSSNNNNNNISIQASNATSHIVSGNNSHYNNNGNASEIVVAAASIGVAQMGTTTTTKTLQQPPPSPPPTPALTGTTTNAVNPPDMAASTSRKAAATTATTSTIITTTTTKDTNKPNSMEMQGYLQDTPSVAKDFASTLGVYEKAAVGSDKQVCSQIGSNVLARNGSAVDAAIATMLCNGLLTMHSMGIGGGMQMNVYVRENQHAYSVDAREVAPYAAEASMFDANPMGSNDGPAAISVPGEVMGYHRAHERFGKLPWRELVEPSLKICQDGFYLSYHQSSALKRRWTFVKNSTQLSSIYVNPANGEAFPVGSKLKPSKQLCDTYQMLADNGPLDFYNGTLSTLIMADLKELGSQITAYDLEAYVADLVSSITMPLGDNTIFAMPPVSSGTVVAHILSILEGFNFTQADLVGDEREALTIHRFTEAFKLGFAKRYELGDIRFTDVRELVSKLTNPNFGAEQRMKINDTHVYDEIYDYGAQFVGNEDAGTSHLAILAPNGDAVSVTSSINDYFGSGMVGPRTGIVFNSGMNDFSVPQNAFNLPPSPSNTIEGSKRAMSSMSPMLLADSKGDIRLAVGAAGGPKIIPAVVEVIARVLWFGQDIKTAIDAPRFYHQLLPNTLQYEPGRFNEEVLRLLRNKGHVLQPLDFIGSVVCGIVRNETAIYANADFRKRGGIAGF